jgi:hypothetical protein
MADIIQVAATKEISDIRGINGGVVLVREHRASLDRQGKIIRSAEDAAEKEVRAMRKARAKCDAYGLFWEDKKA